MTIFILSKDLGVCETTQTDRSDGKTSYGLY